MAYSEIYYHTYCNSDGQVCRVSFQEWDPQGIELFRRGHFNDVAPSEIGIFTEGVDFSFLQIGDSLQISQSASNNGVYTITGWVEDANDEYIRIQLSPQVPVQVHEDVKINIFPAAREVDAGPIAFAKTQENSEQLKKGGVFPTTATVTFVSSDTFDMELLYTADETKYLIQHLVGGQQDWVGNVIPNGFYEDRHGESRYMVITASDRLTVLQGILFTDTDGTNYGISDGVFRRSFIWAIKEALKKTGFLMPIWTMVDVKPATTDNVSIFAVDISFNVSLNFILIRDYSKTVKNAMADGLILKVNGGTRAGETYVIQSYTVLENLQSDVITITPAETLVGDNEGYNTSISIMDPQPVADQPDPLVITDHDVRTWVNEADEIGGQNYFQQRQTAKTTWEVLDAIARQWNARIQLNGDHWEVVRWNAYKVGDGEYQWFQYNAEGVFTGRAPFSGTIEIPCDNTVAQYEIFGSQIGMDRVLKGVNVNYRYKYKVEGDSLINLIKNGNFVPPAILYPPPSLDPSIYTPQNWRRYSYSGRPFNIEFFGAPPTPDYAPGVDTFARFSGQFMFSSYLTSEVGYPARVDAGDRLSISWWQRTEWMSASGGLNALNMNAVFVVRIMIRPAQGDRYTLVNAGASGLGMLSSVTPEQESSPVPLETQWVNPVEYEDDTIAMEVGSESFLGAPATGMSDWRKYTITTPAVPVSGQLVFEIVGLGNPFPTSLYVEDYFLYSYFDASGNYRNRERTFTELRSGDMTAVFVAKLVDPSSEAVPQIHGYTYPDPITQQQRDYTDTISDIEVLTGDDGDPDHVSNITVNGSNINKWDTWANEYGWSALGLVLAKSIAEQYWVPWRILEGSFSSSGVNWSTRFVLEDRPGEKYVILRGTINPDQNLFTGTLVQIYDQDAPPLPPGGNDGGNTTNPNWTPNGTTRCVRGEDGLNTGDVEQLEIDINPASNTYNQQRWVNIGENTSVCPIGEPIDLYWGATTLPISVGVLEYFPYVKTLDEYTVKFDNDGSGKYLVFLWRKSLGVVQSILDVELEETISSWQVEPDMVINGYTYGVMRMQYMTGVFSGLDKTFIIN